MTTITKQYCPKCPAAYDTEKLKQGNLPHLTSAGYYKCLAEHEDNCRLNPPLLFLGGSLSECPTCKKVFTLSHVLEELPGWTAEKLRHLKTLLKVDMDRWPIRNGGISSNARLKTTDGGKCTVSGVITGLNEDKISWRSDYTGTTRILLAEELRVR